MVFLGLIPLWWLSPQNKISISIYNPLKNRLLAVPNEPNLRITAAQVTAQASCLHSCTRSGLVLLWLAAQVAAQASCTVGGLGRGKHFRPDLWLLNRS